MNLQVDSAEVAGGYRIIDTDRTPAYQGVALVVQRDPHAIYPDCKITRSEALERAVVMAAAPYLLEALRDLLFAYEDPGNTGSTHNEKVIAARAAIEKATGHA